MALTTIPEKTEESLGIVKQDALPYTDPNTQVPAVQYERLKDAVIATSLAIGLGDGSTPSSIEARLKDLLGSTTPADVGAAKAGTSTEASRADHVHAHGAQGGGSLHAAASSLADGFMSAADKAALDGHVASTSNPHGTSIANIGAGTLAQLNAAISDADVPPDTRQVIAGAGLTGGGSLAADRTISVAAHADGSIVVNADDVQVGVLATDGQHGTRGGGSLHANAVPLGPAGFMTGADKSKLDGIEPGADVTDATNVAAAGAVMDSDFSGTATGRLRRTGPGTYAVVKDNWAATSAPGAANDSTQGYEVGSQWLDTTGDQLFLAIDVAAAAAVWVKVPRSAGDVSAVPTTRQVIAGSGLTGGGALSGNVTLNVIANADGSIVVNANDVQVGVLASDVQHGARGGGTAHSVATGGAAGFMAAADKSKLDGIEAGADVTDAINVDAAGALMHTDFAGTALGRLIRTATTPTYAVIKDNLAAAVDPTASDDTTAGYAVGSFWLNTTAQKAFICLKSTAAAAVWRLVPNLTTTAASTVDRSGASAGSSVDAARSDHVHKADPQAVYTDTDQTYSADKKQTFGPGSTKAGINVGSYAGDPSTLADGDIWYNSNLKTFRRRENGTSMNLDTDTQAGGSTTQIQYAAGGGTFGASADLSWDNTNKVLAVGAGATIGRIDLTVTSGSAGSSSDPAIRIGLSDCGIYYAGTEDAIAITASGNWVGYFANPGSELAHLRLNNGNIPSATATVNRGLYEKNIPSAWVHGYNLTGVEDAFGVTSIASNGESPAGVTVTFNHSCLASVYDQAIVATGGGMSATAAKFVTVDNWAVNGCQIRMWAWNGTAIAKTAVSGDWSLIRFATT